MPLTSLLSPHAQRQLAIDRLKAKASKRSRYHKYFNDPVGFTRDILGETITDEIAEVMEAIRDYSVVVVESGNAVGKTHGAARVAIWWHKTRLESQVYLASAPPEKNLRRLLWGEISYVTSQHESMFFGDRVGAISLQDKNNPLHFVEGVTIPSTGTSTQREAKFSGKHAPSLMFILDEADAIPPEVFKGIESCLSGENGRLLVMYNPRTNEGPVAKLIARGAKVIKIPALTHPNVVTGENRVPGAVSRNITLNRIHKWTKLIEDDSVIGYGRFVPPDYLVGVDAIDEQTGNRLPPLTKDERVIIRPEFCYMVLADYPGADHGVVYDVFSDENVSSEFDYEEGAGPIFWAIDEGYEGAYDAELGTFTKDSHPRVFLLHQLKPNGDLVCFDELWKVKTNPEAQIKMVEEMGGYPIPEFVVFGPGSSSIAGRMAQAGYMKRTVNVSVEDSIKEFRVWIGADMNGHRRYKINPRCKHYLKEFKLYKRDDNGRLVKAFDHGVDAGRYLVWTLRHGL